MSRNARLIAIVAGVAVLVTLFVLLRPKDEDPGTQPSTPVATSTPDSTSTDEPTVTTTPPSPSPSEDVVEIEIAYANDAVEGPDRVPVERGQRVHLVVTSDVVDEVHVHTYDFKQDVGPGLPAEFDFVADVSGVFEVELESSHVLLFRLEVGA